MQMNANQLWHFRYKCPQCRLAHDFVSLDMPTSDDDYFFQCPSGLGQLRMVQLDLSQVQAEPYFSEHSSAYHVRLVTLDDKILVAEHPAELAVIQNRELAQKQARAEYLAAYAELLHMIDCPHCRNRVYAKWSAECPSCRVPFASLNQ